MIVSPITATSTDVRISLADIEEVMRDLDGRSTFFMLDLDRLHDDFKRFEAPFRRRLGDRFVLAYSVKTNYTPQVLRTVRELGSSAEVVSSMEYEMALRAGFRKDQIVVDGPSYDEEFLEMLLLESARINLDGWYMLSVLDRVSRAHPDRQFRVGLRLHLRLPGVAWSRFGFEADDEGLGRVAAWFEAHDNCQLVGLHSHFALAPASAASYRDRLRQMIAASKTLSIGQLDYLDLGGGMRPPPTGPEYEELASVLAQVLEDAYGREPPPTLILEPGTAIVGASVALVTRVQDVKQVDGQVLALIGASNLCFNTMMWKRHLTIGHLRGRAARPEGAAPGSFALVGNTSAERKDVVCAGLEGPIARGDFIVIDRIGAYSANFKPPFIHTCPPMIARTQDSYNIIKRPETVDDVLATYS